MSKYFLLGCLVLPLLGLGQKRPAVPAAKSKQAARLFPPKTLTLTKPCAVLYEPNAAWIKRHKDTDSSGFYTVADDVLYYAAQARDYLSRRNIKIIDTQAQTLRFVAANGSVKVVGLRASAYGWGLLLFNGRTAPKEADLVEPAAAVRAVFGK